MHLLQQRMAEAARSAHRTPSEIELVAVSKQQAWDRVEPVYHAGCRVFGENRVQEAQGRWSSLKVEDASLRLHLIGPLQTNKARDAVALFDVIETLDRPRLARVLADAVQSAGRSPRFLVEVNTGEEPQKAGVPPDALDAFVSDVRKEYGLEVDGLMCIPPVGEAPGPHFALLADLAARNGLRRLSMGMSADFETAIRFGATSVRLGSALFGARPPAASQAN